MTEKLRFGDWHFRPDTHTLSNGTYRTSLEPRVSGLLEYLLRHPDEVQSHDQLVDMVWEGRVVSDEAVRRAVSSLRRALAHDGCDRWIETVHKKGYIAHLPPFTIEVDVDGRTPPPTESEQKKSGVRRFPVPHSPRRLIPVLLVVLLVSLVGVLIYRLVVRDQDVRSSQPHTIAVLPFLNLSDEPGSDFFSDGLSEEVLRVLARSGAFRVTAATSSFQFRDQSLDVRSIGSRLGVQYVVEGSVRRDRDQVRIGAQLIDAKSGFQLWTESYEGGLDDVLEVQERIATEVARALRVVLVQGGEPFGHRTTVSSAAYLEYLRGLSLVSSWVIDDFDAAIDHFRAAIALDPDYAEAYVQLGETLLLRVNDEGEHFRLLPVVTDLVDKALALNPRLGEAYVLRAQLDESSPEAAEADLRRGLSLSPSYTPAYERLADRLFFQLDREEEGLVLIDQAIALDPLRPRNYHMKAYMMMHRGDYEQAEALEHQALAIDSRFRSSLVLLGRIVGTQNGNYARALLYSERAFEIDPRSDWIRSNLVAAHLDLGDLTGARAANRAATAAGTLYVRMFENDWHGAAEQVYGWDPRSGPLTGDSFNDSLVLLADTIRSGDISRARSFVRTNLLESDARSDGSEPYTRLVLATLDYLDGDTEGALVRIADLESAVQARLSLFPSLDLRLLPVLAVIEAAIGHGDAALDCLEQAMLRTDHLFWWWMFVNHPAFDGIRTDPRFVRILTRVQSQTAQQREILGQLRAQES